MSFQNRLCFLHVNLFFLLKLSRMSGLDKAYLKSGIKDKAVTGEYETRKMGLFSSKRKKNRLL